MLDLVAGLQARARTRRVLFISHNLGVIAQDVRPRRRALRRPARRGGAGRRRCSSDPRHPYTVGLLRCLPRGGVRKDHGRLDTIPGFLPQLGEELPGCVFADRCALAEERLPQEEPPLHDLGGGRTRAAATSTSSAHDAAARGGRRRSRCRPIDRDGEPAARASTTSARSFKQDGHDVHALVGRLRRDLAGRDARASSASPAAARRRSPRTLLGLVAPTTGDGRARRPGARRRRSRSATRDERRARCRSSSRTRTRRSTGATRCAGSCSAR